MTEITRTPMIIAAEINGIKEQVRSTVLTGAVEIGRRLIEAKGLLPHGEWKGWLESHVDYSERTAQNMMQLAHEYRDGKGAYLGEISYTKAVLLLGVPEENREAFASAHDLEGMSTRELKEEISRLRQEKADMQMSMEDMLASDPVREAALREADALRNDLDKAKKGVEMAREIKKQDEADKKALKAEIQELHAREIEHKGRADEEIARLKAELQAASSPLIQQIAPPGMEEKIKQLEAQAMRTGAENLLRLRFEQWRDDFSKMMEQLSIIGKEDAGSHGRYCAAFRKVLDIMILQIEKGGAA